MPIQRLHIERWRNLNHVLIEPVPSLNIFFGENGSGKTALLEAIYVLAVGRSFRSPQLQQLIQRGQQDSLIYIQTDQHRFGVCKRLKEEQTLRMDHDPVRSQSEIAKRFPVLLIDPEGLAVLDGGSKTRRQLLDWLLFHVEPRFYEVWQRYQRAMRQRHVLLKQWPSPQLQLDSWESEMAQAGEQLHQMRLSLMQTWRPWIEQRLSILLPNINLSIEYQAGFQTQVGLEQALKQSRQRDMERGHSTVGPHRADLLVRSDLGLAEHSLSRGQKKLWVLGLKLSQLDVLQQHDLSTVVLLDDMTAELDAAAQDRLLQSLLALDCQVFLTTLDVQMLSEQLKTLNAVDHKMFHVKQGCVHDVLTENDPANVS